MNFLELLIQLSRVCSQEKPLGKATELMAQRTVTKDSSVILPKTSFYQVRKSYYIKERMQVKVAAHRRIRNKTVTQIE